MNPVNKPSKVYIVFGVSGCGKSTIGKMLAEEKGLSHYDADDYHPQANLDKMGAGIPLNDSDRLPWLLNLSDQIGRWAANGGAVLSCSALKEKYRQMLSTHTDRLQWIMLKGSREMIAGRMQSRTDHFFDVKLLDSQFADLEEPGYGLKIDITQSPKDIIENIERELDNE